MATGGSKRRDQLLEQILEALKDSKGDQKEIKKEAEDLNKKQDSMKKSLKELPGIKQLYKMTGDEMNKSLKASFKLQERGLARGMNITQSLDRNAVTISHLNDNIQGYAGAVETSMDMFESGLRGNNKEMATLGAMTKITGGNSKKLMGAMAKNTAGLGISQEGMSNLATTTLSMSQQYGMSTEELVDSLGAMSDQLSSFGALGIGAEMQEAGVRIGAALGPAMSEMGPKLLGAFTKGSSMVQSSILGVSKQREKLLKGEGDMNRNAFDLVITAGRNSKKIIDQFTKGARDPAFALEKATDIYGTQILDAKKAYEQMDKAAKAQGLSIEAYAKKVAEEQAVNKEFTQTWDNLKNMVLGPLQKAFIIVGDGILKVFGWIQSVPALKTTLQVLIGVIAGWIAVVKAGQAMGAVKGAMSFGGKAAAEKVAGGGGKAGGGMMKGLGGGLKSLGAGLKIIGSPAAMKGAITILLLATSLIPLAFSMKIMKGVGIETVGVMIAAIAGLALVAALLGFAAVPIAIGAAALVLLGLALIPFAYGAALAAEPLDMLLASLVKVADVPIGKVFLLGPALVSLGLGLVAFNAMGVASGVLGAIGSFFGGGQSPLDKLVTIGKSASDIIKLADALKAIPSALDAIVDSLKSITDKELDKLQSIASLGFMIGMGAADISVASESIAKSSVSPAQDEQVQLLKQAVERLESINESLDGANEQRSTANSQRNEQVNNSKTRPSEMGGK